MATITSTVTSPLGFADSGQTGHVTTVAFARPADVIAYAAEDVISDSASTARAIKFHDAGRNGMIRGASLVTSDAQAATYTLLIFNSEPQNYVDNAAISLPAADAAKLMAVYQFSGSKGFGAFAWQAPAPSPLNPLPVQSYTTLDGSLYGLLVVNSVITPVSAATYTIKLNLEAL